MQRNKRSAKHASKQQKLEKTTSPIFKMENEIFQAPTKLATKLAKEATLLQKKEAKLKKDLLKTNEQIKKSNSRIKEIAKLKTTAQGKKQFAALKKTHTEITKFADKQTKELHETSALLQKTTHAKEKMLGLHKWLNQFNKEWLKTSKKTKTKARKVKKRTFKTEQLAEPTAVTPFFYEATTETVNENSPAETTENTA